MKALKDKLDKLANKADKLRKLLKCREHTQEGKTHKTAEDSPRTQTEKMLEGSRLRNASIKMSLLFHHAMNAELRRKASHTQKRGRHSIHNWLCLAEFSTNID